MTMPLGLHLGLGGHRGSSIGGSPAVNTVAPAISGTRGGTLTATPGTWTGATSVSGQWYADGVATGNTTTNYNDASTSTSAIEYRETALPGSVTASAFLSGTALAMGMNTNFSQYWANEQIYHDLIVGQKILYWDTTLNSGAGDWADVPDAYLDANGWPTSMPPNSTTFALNLMVPDASGPYKITWDDPSGKGTGFFVSGGTQSGNSITFTSPVVQPAAVNTQLKWAINPGGGYPSNFKCRLVSDDGSVVAPNFKARAQAVCQNGGPWRVMHATSVEENPMPNPAGSWTTRFPVNGDGQLKWPIFTSTTRNTGPLYRWDGVSLENFVALGTAINRPIQWSAPWNCDATYLSTAASQWAAFAAATGNKVYAARSNEVWNKGGYHVATQCQNEADYHATLGTKTACRVAATSNITLSGTQTIDGVAVVAGDRVLCVGQTTASQNGVYVVAAGAWSRAADTIATGDEWQVTAGTSFPNTATFRVRTAGTITVGTTALSITRFMNYERYAEKAKELFDAFVSAFTSAGVIDKLECVLEWQNVNTNTAVWDAMIAIAPNYTALSTAPYVGTNTDGSGAMVAAGYGTSYVGPISPIWPSAKSSCDTILGFFKKHNDYVLGKGKKMFVYEAGPEIGFSDVTTFTNFVHDAGNYDYIQYFLQELEKINPNLAGSLYELTQRTQDSTGAAYNAQTKYYGFIEGTYQTPGANTPKYNAVVDFYAGKRSPQTLLSSDFLIAPSDPNGKTVGTVTRHVRGSTITIQAATGFDPALLSAGATTGTSVAITIADKTKIPTAGTYSFTLRETHPGFPAPGYKDTTFSLVASSNSATFASALGIDKDAAIQITNNGLTATCSTAFNKKVRVAQAVSGSSSTFAITLNSITGNVFIGADNRTEDFSSNTSLPGFGDSTGVSWIVQAASVQGYWGGAQQAAVGGLGYGAAGAVVSVQNDDVAHTSKLLVNGTVIATMTGVPTGVMGYGLVGFSSTGQFTADFTGY
jgi:hypothetical protein